MTRILNWHVLYTHLCSTHQEALIACHFKKALGLANLKFCLSSLQLSYIQLHSDTTNCTKRCNLCNGMKSLEICFDATTCDLLRENFRNFVASSRLVTENNVMVHNTLLYMLTVHQLWSNIMSTFHIRYLKWCLITLWMSFVVLLTAVRVAVTSSHQQKMQSSSKAPEKYF